MNDLISFLKNNPDFLLNFPRKKSYDVNEVAIYRKKFPDSPINKVLSQILLQNKMIDRVENPYKMIFTPKAAQQATVWQIAKYHAEKLKNYSEIADLCCGIGADLIYLSKGKKCVYALDIDDATLDYAKFNSKTNPNITFIKGKAEDFDKKVQAIYIDPDRRYNGKRELNPNNYSPSLKDIYSLFKITKNIMIKLSPASNYKKISPPTDYSLEFISCCGELKEILLCFGELADKHLKKVLIADKNVILYSMIKSSHEELEEKELSDYIIEPDPAVIKSRMVNDLAIKLNANPLAGVSSLISSDKNIKTPFGKTYRVIFKDKLKNLASYLKKNEVGELVLKTRGFPIEVEKYRKKFKLKGKKKMVIMIIPQKENFIFLELECVN